MRAAPYFVFLLALTACSSAPTKAFDDPAVAVCEFRLTKGKPPSSYRRISAIVTGTAVEISYETSILNTKPKTYNYRCDFELANGEFTLPPSPTLPVGSQCNVEDLTARAAKVKPGTPEAKALIGEMEPCLDAMKSANKPRLDEAKDVFIPLILSGIYPIKAADTALSQQ